MNQILRTFVILIKVNKKIAQRCYLARDHEAINIFEGSLQNFNEHVSFTSLECERVPPHKAICWRIKESEYDRNFRWKVVHEGLRDIDNAVHEARRKNRDHMLTPTKM